MKRNLPLIHNPLLLSTRTVVVGILCLWVQLTSLHAQEFPKVIHTGMTTPTLLEVEVQDATIVKEADADLFVGRRVDRALLDDPGAYTVTLSNTPLLQITGTMRKSLPWGVTARATDQNKAADGVDDAKRSPFVHRIYLELDRTLDDGERVVIALPDQLGTLDFIFDASTMRSSSIHASHIGWRPEDPFKMAFLSFWKPIEENYGIFDIAEDFPNQVIPDFQILDAETNASTGFSGSVDLWVNPYALQDDGRPDWYETRPNGAGEISYPYQPNATYNLGNPLPDERFWVDRDDTGNISTVRMSPAKTYVYRIDLSGFSQTGTFKIFIPGLGTSYPFEITPDVWSEVATTTLGGLYNHRKGTTLESSRHGYDRPRGHHPDEGVIFYRTSIPHIFHAESPVKNFKKIGINKAWQHFQSNLADPANPPQLQSAWGGYMDAGDWDNRIHHAKISYMLFDLYEIAPEYYAATERDYRLPASETVLPDPIPGGAHDYAGLPDILNEAIWGLDFFRRNQMTSGPDIGAVYPAVEHGDLKGRSWEEREEIYVLAPDPYSNYTYALIAAKAGVVLGKYNPELQSLYRNSALDAWEWAEANAWEGGVYTDGSDASLSSGMMQWLSDWYDTLPDDEFNTTREAELLRARSKIAPSMVVRRFGAAAALYRLTGDPIFRDAVEASNPIPENKSKAELKQYEAFGMWELYLTRDTGLSFYGKIPASFRETAYSKMVQSQLDRYAFSNSRHSWTQLDWGNGFAPREVQYSLLASSMMHPGYELDYIAAMGAGLSFVLGGNPMNKSLTTGLGHDPVTWVLHLDSLRSEKTAPPGITVFGPSNPGIWTFNRWRQLFRNSVWSDLYDDFYYNPESPVETSRSIYPEKTSWPAFESFVEHPEMVHHTEYTVQQMFPMFVFSSFLDKLGSSNTLPTPPPAGYLNVPEGFDGPLPDPGTPPVTPPTDPSDPTPPAEIDGEWHIATGLVDPSVQGETPLVFDQGSTAGGTVNDSAILFKNFLQASPLAIGETFSMSADISFGNSPDIQRGEFVVAFLANNGATYVVDDQQTSAVWERGVTTVSVNIPGNAGADPTSLPGSGLQASIAAGESPGSTALKRAYEVRGSSTQKDETPLFAPNVVLDTAGEVNTLEISLTRDSDTQITMAVRINGTSMSLPENGVLSASDWTANTWNDLTGVAFAFNDLYASKDHQQILLHGITFSDPQLNQVEEPPPPPPPTGFIEDEWNMATGLQGPTLAGGSTLVFDQGSTEGGTLNDAAILFKNFPQASSLAIGETFSISTHLSFGNNPDIQRGEFVIAFYAHNDATPTVGDQQNSAAWERGVASAAVLLPGNSGAAPSSLPGSGAFARISASENPGNTILKRVYEDRGSSTQKDQSGQFTPNVILDSSGTENLLDVSLTRDSDTQITLAVHINGTPLSLPEGGVLSASDWTSTTWDDVSGIAFGFNDLYSSQDHQQIILHELTFSDPELNPVAEPPPPPSGFDAWDWNVATALSNPSLAGGPTLVFDQGSTLDGTVNDSSVLFKNFTAPQAVNIGESITVSAHLSFENADIQRGEFAFAFLAANSAQPVSEDQPHSSVWPRSYANSYFTFAGNGEADPSGLPGSGAHASIGASESPSNDTTFKTPFQSRGLSTQKDDSGSFVPNVIFDTTDHVNHLIISLTRDSDTQITLTAQINGETLVMPKNGVLSASSWTQDTWDTVDGFAFGYDDAFFSGDHQKIILHQLEIFISPAF